MDTCRRPRNPVYYEDFVYTGRDHVASPPQPLVEPLDFSLGRSALYPWATIYAPSLEESW